MTPTHPDVPDPRIIPTDRQSIIVVELLGDEERIYSLPTSGNVPVLLDETGAPA